MNERKEIRSLYINPNSLGNERLIPPFSVPFQNHGMRYNEYEAGKLIYLYGQPSNDLFVLNSGLAEIYRETYNGRRVVYGKLQAPWVLSNVEPSGIHSTSAAALAPSSTVAIDREWLPHILQENPQFAVWVLQVNSASLSLVYDSLELITTKKASQRCAYYLLNNAQENRDSSGNVISYTVARIPQQLIADAIGSSRESVNKQLGLLSIQGVVRMNRKSYVFTDREKLQNIAEGQFPDHHQT